MFPIEENAFDAENQFKESVTDSYVPTCKKAEDTTDESVRKSFDKQNILLGFKNLKYMK